MIRVLILKKRINCSNDKVLYFTYSSRALHLISPVYYTFMENERWMTFWYFVACFDMQQPGGGIIQLACMLNMINVQMFLGK